MLRTLPIQLAESRMKTMKAGTHDDKQQMIKLPLKEEIIAKEVGLTTLLANVAE